jgi:hypothetical protein
MYGQSIAPNAYPDQLLDDYLTVAERRHPLALYTTVLRTRSVAARQLLARAASRSLSVTQLVDAARAGAGDLGGKVNAAALADLAGAVALQGVLPEDADDGLALYDLALRVGGASAIPSRHQGIHAQLALHGGDREAAARLLRTYRSMPDFTRSTLEFDLANPFVADPDQGASAANGSLSAVSRDGDLAEGSPTTSDYRVGSASGSLSAASRDGGTAEGSPPTSDQGASAANGSLSAVSRDGSLAEGAVATSDHRVGSASGSLSAAATGRDSGGADDITSPRDGESAGASVHDSPRVSAWLAKLSTLVPSIDLRLSDDADLPPLDRLAAAAPRVDSDTRVSVVVSAYHPDRGLITSVRSLLAQSWANLEILVVDDGSPAEFDGVLDECAALDPRVKVVKLAVNAGTYTARNTALDQATGDFVTFHDSDDWAHPRRIERQVAPLQADTKLMATLSHALTVSDQLFVTKPGRALKLLCTPSLMFRRAAVTERLGYFDSIRKAADTEYLRRIGAAFGSGAVKRLPEILTLMRQGADSLSRAEFRAGWKHPARDAYQSAYRPWHEEIKRGAASPYLDKDPNPRPFAAPARFAKRREPLPRYDVVLACDWRPFGGPQKSMLEEIAAMTGAGRRVAILHLESFRHMTEVLKPLCAPIQELINAGVVDQVLPTDEVTTTLLVLRYPPVLQFRAEETIAVKPSRMVILANQAPSELDGTDLRYVPAACTAVAERLFGVRPVWYPQGPAVREALEPALDPADLADDDMPGIIDDSDIRLPRKRFRSELPVVGRHSRDDWTKWPIDGKAVLDLYPDSPDIDVRVMGGAKTAKALLRRDELPANWIVYQRGELDVRNFLRQLDFYAYFPHPNMIEAFGRAILEALAAGCVTLLPHRFAPVFGDAAIYCEPREVPALIAAYRADPDGFLAQSALAQQRVRERFSHRSYLDLVAPLLEPAPTMLEGTAS